MDGNCKIKATQPAAKASDSKVGDGRNGMQVPVWGVESEIQDTRIEKVQFCLLIVLLFPAGHLDQLTPPPILLSPCSASDPSYTVHFLQQVIQQSSHGWTNTLVSSLKHNLEQYSHIVEGRTHPIHKHHNFSGSVDEVLPVRHKSKC